MLTNRKNDMYSECGPIMFTCYDLAPLAVGFGSASALIGIGFAFRGPINRALGMGEDEQETDDSE